MNILKELTESQLFTSKTGFRKHTGRELVEMLYLNIMAFRILTIEDEHFARNYARKTKYYNGFSNWHFTNITDLYLLVYGVTSGDIEVSQSTDGYLKTVNFDEKKFLLWVKAVSSGEKVAESYASRFFLTIDQQLKINNTTYRSIRRLVGNWTDIGKHEQKLAITRLLQLMHDKSRSSDLLHQLEKIAHEKNLKLSNSEHLEEDDGGGAAPAPAPASASVATTSSDIATLVKPMGKVRRRIG